MNARMEIEVGQPFRLFPSGARGRTAALVAACAERISGLTVIGNGYARVRREEFDRPFAQAALDHLGITLDVPAGHVARVPATGPVIVVANHPHGAVDGLALLALLSRRRRDVKVLANRLLARVPEIAASSLLVDVLGRPGGRRNTGALRDCLRWLGAGHVLLVFPAGEVSHVRAGERLVDGDWHPGIASLAGRSGACVIPAFIDGDNGRWFELAGRLHPVLRTLLLPRALLRARGRTLAVRIGEPIPAEGLARLEDVPARLSELRFQTYRLGLVQAAAPAPETWKRPVARGQQGEHLAADVAALPSGALLARGGAFEVFSAAARDLPAVLPEIGRLRELTFRQVGEGTGRPLDLDRFDLDYEHLFVWNRERREVVGAYRVGRTDRLLERHGPRGLYTQSLFSYSHRFPEILGPCLELGRSFVRLEYQRDFNPLQLLWRGIGQLIVREPRYRFLFGPVSISASYSPASRHLIADFLGKTRLRQDLAALVRPRHTLGGDEFAQAVLASRRVESIADLDRLVRAIEPDGKGLPVLLRQYLRLNARVLGFSVDPAFAGALDALVLVDLHDVERPLLKRYLGEMTNDE